MSLVISLLRRSRLDLLRAARYADQRGDTERHQRIMSALCSVDDAIAPERPLTEEVRTLMEELPNA